MKLLIAAVAATVSTLPAAAAPHIGALAAAYGARPLATRMRLSPSGDKIVYLTSAGTRGRAAVVADIATGATQIVLSSPSADASLYDCRWKNDERVLCMIYYHGDVGADLIGMRRTMSIAADGSSRVMLAQRGADGDGGEVINLLPDDPDHILMQVRPITDQATSTASIGRVADGLSVQRVDVLNSRMATVERPNRAAFDYGADNKGVVRYMAVGSAGATGYTRDEISHMVRARDGEPWRKVATGTPSGPTKWEFDGFDETGEGMFVLRTKDGRAALFRDGVDPGGLGGLIYANPNVDVDGVLRIGKYRRPVAAIYTTDTTHYEFFDAVLDRRAKALSKALPGNPPVDILDESWDGKRNLVFAGGVSDPGHYYRYDTVSKQLTPLLPVRRELDGLASGVQTSVAYAAPDGASVPAYLTVPPGPAQPKRPAIIMPHGGPAARDALGFDWLAQFYAQLGYLVLQPNFRGSTGYGEEWYAKNGFKSWETAMADINAGARWLVAQGLADPARLAIVGWSYGGYAALQASSVEPGLYKAVVAVAPVTDLAQRKREALQFSNYKVVANYIGDGPHVLAGSPSQNAGRIAAPVLMFHGDKDLNVNIAQSRTMDRALASAGKRHELIVYPGLDHPLDDSGARADLLRRSADWLAAAMK